MLQPRLEDSHAADGSFGEAGHTIHRCPFARGWVRPRGSGPKPGSPGQLYNLRKDLTEQNNLFAEHPEIVQRLAALLERYQTEGRSAPID